MKQVKGAAADLRPIKGAVLGARSARGQNEAVNVPSQVLVGLSAFAFGELNGRILIGLERHFKIEPTAKPALRKFISDSFARPPSLAASKRQLQRFLNASPNMSRHHQAHVMMNGLCSVARGSGLTGRETIAKLIEIGKALELTQDEMLEIFRKTGLAA